MNYKIYFSCFVLLNEMKKINGTVWLRKVLISRAFKFKIIHFTFFISLLCLSAKSPAQNLVKNPSFEQISNTAAIAPCTYTARGELFNESILNWQSYRGLTPDILTFDSSQTQCFPVFPHSGKRFAGIITYHPRMDSGYDFDYHEFLQGELKKPLKINQLYTFEVWIYSDDSLGKRHLHKVLGEKATTIIPVLSNNFGIQFSETPLDKNKLWRDILATQKSQYIYANLLNTNGKWKKIQFLVKADKPYQYLQIGNFHSDSETSTTLSPERSHYIDSLNSVAPLKLRQKGIFWERKKRIAYYCLDDISLREGDFMEKQMPDFQPNTSYNFQSIVFETGKATLIKASCAELDVLLDFLKKQPSQRILIIGHTDNIGNASFNLELSQKRAESVRNYLINKGLEKSIIETEGKGSSQAIQTNETELGRQQNRRVEILLK